MIDSIWNDVLPQLRSVMNERGLRHIQFTEGTDGDPNKYELVDEKRGLLYCFFKEFLTFEPSDPNWRIYRVKGAPAEDWIDVAKRMDSQEVPKIAFSEAGTWELQLDDVHGAVQTTSFFEEFELINRVVDYLVAHYANRFYTLRVQVNDQGDADCCRTDCVSVASRMLESSALEEVEHPSLSQTSIYLSIHHLDDKPVATVWKIDEGELVFLRLKNQKYYLVYWIRGEGDRFVPRHCYVSSHACVTAVVESRQTTPAEVSTLMALPETCQQKFIAAMPSESDPLSLHRWLYTPSAPDCIDLETKLQCLLEEIEDERVRVLPSDCDFRIHILLHQRPGKSQVLSVSSHLEQRLIDLGWKLNVEFCVSGPDLPDLTVYEQNARWL